MTVVDQTDGTCDLVRKTLGSAIDTQPHRGSLRSKLVLSLATIFLIFLVVDEVVRRQVIQPEFASLEYTDSIRDANRVLAALNVEKEHLLGLTEHWAARLSQDGNEASKRGVESTHSLQKHEWAVLRSNDGSLDWIETGDLNDEQLSARSTQVQLQEIVTTCLTSEGGASGMTKLSDEVAIFAVVNIFPQSNDSKHLIVARNVDSDLIAALRRQTQVHFTLRPSADSTTNEKLLFSELDQSTLITELQLPGLNRKPLAWVTVHKPRDITARAIRTTTLARSVFIFGSVAALLVLLLMLQRIVIGPLTEMREYSDRVAVVGVTTKPLLLNSNDEIGHLAKAFDNMVERLGDTQTKLSKASQAAGRSQVASTVIHNVGNVLTNVNSLLDAATGRVNELRIAPLDKLADRLRQAQNDDPLLQATPDYLAGLAGSLTSEQETIGELLKTLHDNIRHIHDVIRDQQRHASKSVSLSHVDLGEVIDEAIGCCLARLEAEQVIVEFTNDKLLEVESDRSLLLQTFINIIGNARHAMSQQSSARRLKISIEAGGTMANVTITDNGCGMSQETLSKVFDAHFTTRETGSGLGLHFCANALKRLGGSISATSQGEGSGSTFSINLPLPKGITSSQTTALQA